ncbi:hypothetical protein [Streptomyces sp. URMC 129]|uniref:hypothetical protein n=1 Tax=Streptomyces sp. URMC 129 TaxID=3423407 RepID=UPI003F52A2F1
MTDYCEYEGCGDEYCLDVGHCACLCHSGKTCPCGHRWPRQEPTPARPAAYQHDQTEPLDPPPPGHRRVVGPVLASPG